MANIDDILGSLDNQNKARITEQDKDTQLNTVIQTGDKVVRAVDNNARATSAGLNDIKGEVKVTNTDLAKSQDVSQAVDAINKLNLTTFMQNEGLPQLAQNLSDLSNKTSDLQERLENEGLKKMGDQLSLVVKKLDEVTKTISKTEISVDSKLQKTIDSLSKSIGAIDFNPAVNITSPPAKIVTTPIDFLPVVNALKEVEQSIKTKKTSETKLDLLPLTTGLGAVQEAIQSLRFPVSNYVLPFSSNTGKATQAVLNADGTLNVNVSTMTGIAPSVGNGITDSGTQRVTLSSDSTGQVKLTTGTSTVGNVGHAADSLFTGTITANGGTVTTTPVSGMAGWTMAYYGTYATGASLTMEASFDSGATYQSVRMLQGSSGTLGYVITIAAVVNSTQFFIADIPSGATNLRVRCSAWPSPTGTINVIIGQSVERYATPAIGGQTVNTNGLKTTNVAVPAATNLGVLPAIANATAPVFTETFQTALSADLAANVRVVQYAATSTLTNVASSATNVTLLSSNTAAKSRVVFNESTQILYLKYGVTASATSYTVQVGANAYFEFPQPTYYGQVDGIWASANGNARITEVI